MGVAASLGVWVMEVFHRRAEDPQFLFRSGQRRWFRVQGFGLYSWFADSHVLHEYRVLKLLSP